jgi:hypothetical protein
MELAYQATSVGLEIAQAADSAARSTLDENQRRMMELSYQSTLVSQDMAQAAATERFIRKQTQAVQDANATAQSSAATASYSAYALNVTQTAYYAQEIATQQAYALTATPQAAIQAAIIRKQDKTNRRALWDEFIVTPVTLILSTLGILLLMLGSVLAFRRLMPVLELRLRTISRGNGHRPLILLDGMSRDPDLPARGLPPGEPRQANISRLTSVATAQVEVVDPSADLDIAGWIAEAEQILRGGGDNVQ